MKIIENIKTDIKERNSSIFKEILAGIASFLSLSYIFVVNPAIATNATYAFISRPGANTKGKRA